MILWLWACAGVREGVQIGEEKVEVPPSCEPNDEALDPGDPSLALLEALPLQADATLSWSDGADSALAVELQWDNARRRTWQLVPGVESCPPASLLVDLAGPIRTEDGQLDETVAIELELDPALGGTLELQIPAEEVGGSLDVDAIAASWLGEIDRASLLALSLPLEPDAPSHGTVSVAAWPDPEGPPASPDETVLEEIAVW